MENRNPKNRHQQRENSNTMNATTEPNLATNEYDHLEEDD